MATQAAEEQLTVAGSTTLKPVLEQLVEGFSRRNRGFRMTVSGGGSAEGISALLTGKTDVASSSRFITPGELARAEQLGIYPVPFQVAYDAIIPVVHKNNPLRSLSLAQLRDIYLGRVDNWQQLGGKDRDIRVVSRGAGSGTLDVWQQLVTGDSVPGENAMVVSSNEEVVRMVSRDRRAIGYVGLGHLSASVKPLRVGEVIGSLSNVRTGAYPLGRSLYLFTDGWPRERVMAFINFVLDPDQGQRIVEQAGFIPLYDHRRH